MDIVSNIDLNLSVDEFIQGLFREKESSSPRAVANISGEEVYPEMYRLR